MLEFKRTKKSRSKNTLFNPYKNGITTYDMAYLSSKKSINKNQIVYLKHNSSKEYNAA